MDSPSLPDDGSPFVPSLVRYYFFALRDELPLGHDWLVTAHEIRPGFARRDFRCGFLKIDGTDESFAQGMNALESAVERVIAPDTTAPPGVSGVEIGPALDPIKRPVFVAVVAAELRPGEDVIGHQRACFERLQCVLGGLALATNAPIPELTIERVWPMYLIGRSIDGQPLEIMNVVLVEHGFNEMMPANEAQLRQAVRIADDRAQSNPVESYRYFEHRAMTDAWHAGNYLGAVLNAAAASEVLLKHLAWLLTWEATTQLDRDPQPAASVSGLLDATPQQLIGQVLMRRLRGDWTSRAESKPVGCWRINIAQMRNQVLHRGYRPDEAAAKNAVAAIDHLEGHLIDRVAANVATYPRTSLLLAGETALTKRGVWDDIAAFAASAHRQAPWLPQYLDWLDRQEQESRR